MLVFLTTRRRRSSVDMFLAGYGRALLRHVRPMAYEDLFARRRYPAASYLFADLERLSVDDLGRATRVWEALHASGRCPHLLNHPNRVLGRYELLRTLADEGINDFDVYRVAERRLPERYPVFVRDEHDHHGPLTPLLGTPAELAAAVEDLIARAHPRTTLLVTEFCGEPVADGEFEKYGAYVVRGRVLPCQVIRRDHWCVKHGNVETEETVARELRYIEANPHEAVLRRVFELANVDFGRADYGIVGGRVQVYEINTNPMIGVPEDILHVRGRPVSEPRMVVKDRAYPALVAALGELARPAPSSSASIPAPRLRRKRALLETDAVWGRLLRPLGLAHRLPLVLAWDRMRASRRGARRAPEADEDG